MKRLITWTAVVLSAVIAFHFWPGLLSAPEPGSGRRQDEHCQRVLNEGKHQEARAWLAQSKAGDLRNIGEQTPAESRAIVERLYSLGALDVQAAVISPRSGGEWSNILIVQLPDAPD